MLLLFIYFDTESHYVVQADLELEILLPQPPECWDYPYATPCSAELLGLD
jgi:hypothetical protein